MENEETLELDTDIVRLTRENIPMVSEKTGRTEKALLRALVLGESRGYPVHIQLYLPPWRREGYEDPAARVEINNAKRASDLEHHSNPHRRSVGATGASDRV